MSRPSAKSALCPAKKWLGGAGLGIAGLVVQVPRPQPGLGTCQHGKHFARGRGFLAAAFDFAIGKQARIIVDPNRPLRPSNRYSCSSSTSLSANSLYSVRRKYSLPESDRNSTLNTPPDAFTGQLDSPAVLPIPVSGTHRHPAPRPAATHRPRHYRQQTRDRSS